MNDFNRFEAFLCRYESLSGFKSDGAVKGVRGGVRMGNNESVRTPQHLARRGVRTF